MPKKILIVDDEADIFTIEQIRLESFGYEIVGAKDAESAMEFLQKCLPDLILLDLLLPKMQGDEFCKKLKSDEQYKNIPVILYTYGYTEKDGRDGC